MCRSPVAVNYSAESPQGSTLVTLGDDDKVVLHLRDSTGRALSSLKFLLAHCLGSLVPSIVTFAPQSHSPCNRHLTACGGVVMLGLTLCVIAHARVSVQASGSAARSRQSRQRARARAACVQHGTPGATCSQQRFSVARCEHPDPLSAVASDCLRYVRGSAALGHLVCDSLPVRQGAWL